MEPVSAESLLPIEVWGKVFEQLEAKDAVNCRVVCSAWTAELDEHFHKWAIRLDQNSPHFHNFLELKVKEATICNLSTPVGMGQEETPRLFKHPELLQNIFILRGGQICAENLLFLLQSCRGNIKNLDLEMFGWDDEFLVHADYNLQSDFGNLEALKLGGSSPKQPILEHTVLNMILGLSTMRKIKYLDLDLDICPLFWNDVSSTILAFIANNGKNLEVINFSIQPGWDTEEPPRPRTLIDMPALREVLGLKNIKIGYLKRSGIDLDPELVRAWSALLEVQRNLTHLDLYGLPISRRILKLACPNNQNTIMKLRLGSLTFDFDLAILAHCIHLKELEITAYSRRVLWNVGSLPLGIQKFSSSNYLIDSEDIWNFFEYHRELVDIKFTHSGSGGSNGVTASLLARFVRDRDLSDKLRRVYVRDFNHSSVEAVAALNDIFRSLKTWKDIQDFREVFLTMYREKGEDGQWSAWKVGV